MSVKEFFSILGYYIRRKLPFLVFAVFSFAVSMLMASLYGTIIESVLYAWAVCLFVLVVYLVIDFAYFFRKHLKLRAMLEDIKYDLKQIPCPKDLIERDYVNLIDAYEKEKSNFVTKSERSRDEMIDYYSMWVHQIKTPIAAMRLLLETKDFEYASALKSELFKIEQYVEMVLSYLRLDSDYTDYVIREYDLDSIIKHSLRKYAHIFIEKKISIDFKPTNMKVLTDEKWLSFVIEQLLSNALKYTKKGSVSIYSDDAKVLCIKDTGIGIAYEDINRIFEKGFTGINGRKDKSSSGIGLYLCRRVLKNLSHSISVVSVPGEGTTVKLDLSSEKLGIE